MTDSSIFHRDMCYLLIKATPLFQRFKAEEVPPALRCLQASMTTAAKNAHFPGVTGIVLNGQIQVETWDENGARQVVATLTAGHLFGFPGIFDRRLSPDHQFTIIEDSILLNIDLTPVLHPTLPMCPLRIKLMENLMELLIYRNEELHHKIEVLSQRSLRQRIITFLKKQNPSGSSTPFTVNLSREAMADTLITNRSALSRELGRLRDEGFLDFHKNSFTLHEQ